MSLYVRTNNGWALQEGPRVFAYSSTEPAAAPWKRVTEVRGPSTSLWTLSNPQTFTFDSTLSNTLRSKTNYDQANYYPGDTFYDSATYWHTTTDVLMRGTVATGKIAATSTSPSRSRQHIGVAGSFKQTGTAVNLETVLANALVERPVIKSASLTLKRVGYDAADDWGDTTTSGTYYTCKYDGLPAFGSRASYYKVLFTNPSNSSVSYQGSLAFSKSTWDFSVTIPININLVYELINNPSTTSIAFTDSNDPNNWSVKTQTASSGRAEMRGPQGSTSRHRGTAGTDAPTLTVVLDYN